MANLLIREGRPAEIMLIEDNRGDALLASRAFKDADIENNLTVARTGEEALALLRGETAAAPKRLPDIILLDLNLPGASGDRILAAIKGDDRLKHIPVIVLSNSGAEADVARSYDLHASAYVVKPIDLKKFREVVTTIQQFFFLVAVLPASDAA